MSEDIAYTLILQRIDDMMSGIHDMKEAQIVHSRDSRETAIKLERVLGNIEILSRAAESQKETQKQVDQIDIRLSLVEESLRDTPEYVADKHKERIEKIERSNSRFMTSMVTLIILTNVMVFIAKEIL